MSQDYRPFPFDEDTILLGFQLIDFLAQAGSGYVVVQEDSFKFCLRYVRRYYEDPRPITDDREEPGGARTRSTSRPTPTPRWPGDWIEAALVRKAIKDFKDRTAELRKDPSFQRSFKKSQEQDSEAYDEILLSLPTRPSISRRPTSMSRGRESGKSEAKQIMEMMDEHYVLMRQEMQEFRASMRQYAGALPSNKPSAAHATSTVEEPVHKSGAEALEAPRSERQDKFVAGDVGFFHPFYNDKSVETGAFIEHSGKDIYFRDVFLFTERAKDVARINTKVKENLQICLRGEAVQWYSGELSFLEKSLMAQSIDGWCTALIDRFKPPMEEGIKLLNNVKYTMHDAANHREPREYGQARIRAAKIAETTDIRQVIMHMWMGLDTQFRIMVKKPKPSTTVSAFFHEMDDCKREMWALGREHTRASRGTAPNNTGRQRPGNQYAPRPQDQVANNRNPPRYPPAVGYEQSRTMAQPPYPPQGGQQPFIPRTNQTGPNGAYPPRTGVAGGSSNQ